MSTTKKQHFVWRKYLVPWTDNQQLENGKLYVFRKNPKGTQEVIEFRELMKVGFEKFYYDITGFSEADWTLFKQYITNFQKASTVKFCIRDDLKNDINAQRDFLEKNVICIGEDIDNEFGFLEKIKNKDLSFYHDSIAQQSLFWLHHLLEASQLGQDICVSDEEIANRITMFSEHCEDTDFKYKFNEFICYQFCRSPHIIQSQISAFDQLKSRFPEIKACNSNFFGNMNAIFFAMNMAINLSQYSHSYIELIENQTTISFITGDCPVTNIAQDPHKSLEFYYPITPNIAILIKTSNHFKDNDIQSVTDEDYINFLNRKIFTNSTNEVYSNDMEILNKYASF